MSDFQKSLFTSLLIALVVTGGSTIYLSYLHRHGELSEGFLGFYLVINLLLPLFNIGMSIFAMSKKRKLYAYGWLTMAAIQIITYVSILY